MIDFGVSNYMISLNKSYFINYSINLSDLNIIKRINKNIKILDINIIILITSNKNEFILHDILYTPELFYSLLSLNQLIIIDNIIILFNDSYYIIENNIEFHIKFKFESFYDIISILFHFHIDFPVTEFNIIDFKSINSNLTDFESINSNLTDFESTITENQIIL